MTISLFTPHPLTDEQESTPFSEYTVFEVDNEIASQIEQGMPVVLRGGPDDDAVLCTATKTWSVRQAETSNLLLLFHDIGLCEGPLSNAYAAVDNKPPITSWMLADSGSQYYQAEPMVPTAEKLFKLLDAQRYSGPDNVTGLAMHDLLDTVQASQAEILELLSSIDAHEIEGI